MSRQKSHPFGVETGRFLDRHLNDVMTHSQAYYQGLQRVTPEWYGRDFRLRLRWGRNQVQRNVWSGRRSSGPCTGTLRLRKRDTNVNGTTVIPD